MKTTNKAVSVLWRGIALVAILVSIIAVGAGASMVYAGGESGGGSSESGGGISESGGGTNESGCGTSESGIAPGNTFTVTLTLPDPAEVTADGLPVNFCVQVTLTPECPLPQTPW